MRPSLLLVGLALLGCDGDGGARAEMVVYAASSLTEAFTALESAYEAEHPGVDVRLSFAGSQMLRLQIEQGARADVFASADERHMAALRDADRVAPPTLFAANELVVITPVGDERIRRLEDLRTAQRVVLGDESVPVGRYARQLLRQAGLWEAVQPHVVSEEANVRLVRAKVEIGEADAALVYRTDARTDRVRAVAIPDDQNVRTRYPIAVTRDAPHPAEAARFVAFVRSEAGSPLGCRAEDDGAPALITLATFVTKSLFKILKINDLRAFL